MVPPRPKSAPAPRTSAPDSPGDQPGRAPRAQRERHEPGNHPEAQGEPQRDQAAARGVHAQRGDREHGRGRQARQREVVLVPRPDQHPVQDEHHARHGLLDGRDQQHRQQQAGHARRDREQIIDHVNLDQVTFSGFSEQAEVQAEKTIRTFADYIAQHKDEIQALGVFYEQPYQRRALTLDMIEELHYALGRPPMMLTTERLWSAYARVKASQVKGADTKRQLTDLIALVPKLTKVCSARFVPELVKRALPGLPLNHLLVAPTQIRARVESQYFAINRSGPCWETILQTRQVGAYVPAEIPSPELSLIVLLDE